MQLVSMASQPVQMSQAEVEMIGILIAAWGVSFLVGAFVGQVTSSFRIGMLFGMGSGMIALALIRTIA